MSKWSDSVSSHRHFVRCQGKIIKTVNIINGIGLKLEHAAQVYGCNHKSAKLKQSKRIQKQRKRTAQPLEKPSDKKTARRKTANMITHN